MAWVPWPHLKIQSARYSGFNKTKKQTKSAKNIYFRPEQQSMVMDHGPLFTAVSFIPRLRLRIGTGTTIMPLCPSAYLL